MLCNFAVGVKNVEQFIDANGNIDAKLQLVIICGEHNCEISIGPDCTDNLVKTIQKSIPQAYINPLEKRGNKQLSAYISMMYLHAMVNSINSGELKICSNKELYSAYNDSVGFLDTKNKFLYIRAQDAYNQIVRYWDKMGRYFSTTDKTVRKDLVIHNFLLTQSEERKENTTKVVRINNKEQRFLAFDLVKLEKEYGKIKPFFEE